jgi:6-phosphogluconolactonase
MSVRWHKFPDPAAAAEACCRHIVAILEEALSGKDLATLVLSGGATPKLLFRRLATSGLPWKRIHLFWADERCVPPADPQSNYRVAQEDLIAPAGVPHSNVHRIRGELMPDHAARNYVDEIRDFFDLQHDEMPHFDIVQRGMGADAHTASLFPGEPLLENRDTIAAAVYIEKLKQWRVTLLPGSLMAAKHTVFLVTGAGKAEAVRNVFQAPYDALEYPAQIASHHSRRVAWFLDDAAASLMD